uniref:Uncharacterized protein n=1 Tax=Rhizophora mucronata TaxID=61149 RepID=A0A2P2KWJ8_RHIMU
MHSCVSIWLVCVCRVLFSFFVENQFMVASSSLWSLEKELFVHQC